MTPELASELKAAIAKLEAQKATAHLRRRRYDRHYRRCEPLDHARPWEKYARRGVPSSIAVQDLGRVNRMAIMFSPRLRGVANNFGISALGILDEWIGGFRRGKHAPKTIPGRR